MLDNVPKILVVDDTPANLAVMRRLLGKLECEVIEAQSGNEALAALLDHRDFALILLDVQMPEMDGYEVASLVRSDDETIHIPIIFVTAAAADEMHEEQGYESGAIDYVTKPIRPQILLSKVRIFLELWHSRRRIEDANLQLEATVDKRTRELRDQLQLTEEAKRTAEEALRVADEAQKVRTRFLARISHELRTPLNGISGMLQLIQRASLDEGQQQCLKAIELSTSALTQTLNQLIDFADLDRGNVVVEQRPFQLAVLVRMLADSMSAQAEDKGLKLAVEIADDVPLELLGDAEKIRRIISNFLSNAIRFSDQGTIRLVVSGHAKGKRADIRVEVIDQGRGMKKDLIDQVFQGFSQADDSTTRKDYGVGLGLAIAYELARTMGAEVGLDSKPGQGTTAWLQCEVSIDAGAASLAEQSKLAGARIGDGERPRLKVLVAEDNVVNQMVAAGLLKRLNCEVDLATNGKIALDKYELGEYDLILMDLDMPQMDGFDATRGIRSLSEEKGRPRVPIVALTANVASRTRKDCLEAGMDGFIGKPVTGDTLDDVLQEMVYPALGQAC